LDLNLSTRRSLDTPLYREFAKLSAFGRFPDEKGSILRFRHRLEKHNQANQVLLVSTVHELSQPQKIFHPIFRTKQGFFQRSARSRWDGKLPFA